MRKSLLVASAIIMGGIVASAAPAITVQNRADLASAVAQNKFSGVGSLAFVGTTMTQSCTGSLVSSNVVLTAAHCLNTRSDHRFVLPAVGDVKAGSAANIYGIKSSLVIKNYLDPTKNTDIALITLDREVFGRDIYEIYDQKDEIGQVTTLVGAGLSGIMSEGVDRPNSDFKLRYGVNRIDATYSEILKRAYKVYNVPTAAPLREDQFVYDYDNGFATGDAFGRYLGISDLGVIDGGRVIDAGVAYGDSGGPAFIGNRIAGVHASLGAGAYLERIGASGCGTGTSVDYALPDRQFGCADGSWGDFGVSNRVSFYVNPIRAYIAAAVVPEPHSWALMIVGFAAAGASLRRRTRDSIRV